MFPFNPLISQYRTVREILEEKLENPDNIKTLNSIYEIHDVFEPLGIEWTGEFHDWFIDDELPKFTRVEALVEHDYHETFGITVYFYDGEISFLSNQHSRKSQITYSFASAEMQDKLRNLFTRGSINDNTLHLDFEKMLSKRVLIMEPVEYGYNYSYSDISKEPYSDDGKKSLFDGMGYVVVPERISTQGDTLLVDGVKVERLILNRRDKQYFVYKSC